MKNHFLKTFATLNPERRYSTCAFVKSFSQPICIGRSALSLSSIRRRKGRAFSKRARSRIDPLNLDARVSPSPLNGERAGVRGESVRWPSGSWRGRAFIIFLALALLSPLAAHAKLNVVATTPDLGSIAKEVGGDKIDITTLTRPTEDPHFVDARPSFVVKLRKADVLIEGGAELEIGWLPPLLENARNSKLESGAPGHVAASQGIQLLEVPATLDRSKGDIHAAGNPHFLIDPINAQIVARHICDAFCQIDPKSCDAYRGNLKKFTDALDAKVVAWQKLLAPYKGQHVVAYHNSWPYFGERFGLKIDLFLEPKPGIPPTPAHLAEVQSKIKEEKVRVIIVDPYLNRRTAESVARNTGATVLDVTQFPGGVKGTEGGYIQLLDHLVNSVARALETTNKETAARPTQSPPPLLHPMEERAGERIPQTGHLRIEPMNHGAHVRLPLLLDRAAGGASGNTESQLGRGEESISLKGFMERRVAFPSSFFANS